MAYFKLHLTRQDGSSLFESDLDLAEFEPVVGRLLALLVRQNVVPADSRVEARIIPRTDNSPSQRPVVLGIEGGGVQEGLDILFEGPQPPIERITYWTVRLRCAETKTLYRFDFPLDGLLSGVFHVVVQALMDQNVLGNGERFGYRVSALADGQPKEDAVLATESKAAKAVARVSDTEPCGAEQPPLIVVPSSPTAPAEDDLDIVIGPVEELVKPEPKSLQAYTDAEVLGAVGEHDIPIFLRRGAMEQARRSACVSAKADEEVGGFMLGNVYRDPQTSRLFVEISEVVEADRARGTYASLDFNYDAWRQVMDRIDQEFHGKFLIGWYHTHLISLGTASPVEDAPNVLESRYRTFFSHADIFIHRNFFPDPWHVALVMDLRCKNEVFFAWRDGEISSTQGFYLYGS